MVVPSRVRELACAKINLNLHVTAKRADGYHTLDSVVAFADWGDELFFESTAEPLITLACEGPFASHLPLDSAQNLVVKAAHLLQRNHAVAVGAHVHMIKRIPVAAGIGGGSADAAAVLRGLCRVWKLRLSQTELNALALQLGADVPVCVRSLPVQMSGIGNHFKDVALPQFWPILLVNPLKPLTTKAVFERLDTANYQPALPPVPRREAAWADYLQQTNNSLQASAITLMPVIEQILDVLQAQHGAWCVRMSGSGATCFALFSHPDDASAAHRYIQRKCPEWWSEVTKLRTGACHDQA